MSQEKVFGIGFHKTATTSLAVALYMLGYNVTGYFGVKDPDIADKVYDIAFDLADRFDAAQDTPWPVLYRELDKRYPGSKFILTVRPAERWVKSVTTHFKDERIAAHEWIYGVPIATGNEDAYTQRYLQHNEEVQEYFRDRPDDLLVMDITKGDGWEVLCPFLGVPMPSFSFPSRNSAGQRTRDFVKRVTRYVRRKLAALGEDAHGNQMRQGVSATFVRDIVHFHHARYENLWEAVNNLSEDEFADSVAGRDLSVQQLVKEQVAEESFWLQHLLKQKGISASSTLTRACETKEEVYQVWRSNMEQLRRVTALLTDEDCNRRIEANDAYVWEVMVHLLNMGARREAQVQALLERLDVAAGTSSFMDFFRPSELAVPGH